jgi:hypothetical protein
MKDFWFDKAMLGVSLSPGFPVFSQLQKAVNDARSGMVIGRLASHSK